MRIIAGSHRGRRLTAPAGHVARPTGDRTREALFNILAHSEHVDLDGAVVVDAFAGSGALAFEALSRGAARAYLIETHRDSLAAIAANLDLLREAGRATVLRADATKPPPAPEPCTLALLDAPYDKGLSVLALNGLARHGWLAPAALVVVEVAAKETLALPDGFTLIEERVYGAARLVFALFTPPGS